MSLLKSILKNIGKYLWHTLFFVVSLLTIGIVAGITFYLLTEHSYKDCNNQFVAGCMSAGLSEEVCKGRVY